MLWKDEKDGVIEISSIKKKNPLSHNTVDVKAFARLETRLSPFPYDPFTCQENDEQGLDPLMGSQSGWSRQKSICVIIP